jgi:uncharacterized protein (DUF2267 family)
MAHPVRSVRIPQELIDRAQQEARQQGCTLSEVVVEALHRHLGTLRPPLRELLDTVRDMVRSMYPQGDFPPDVTRRVFLDIGSTRALRQLYERCVQGESGVVDRQRAGVVNRAVARTVRRALNANVDTRVGTTDPDEYIGIYTLLTPGKG